MNEFHQIHYLKKKQKNVEQFREYMQISSQYSTNGIVLKYLTHLQLLINLHPTAPVKYLQLIWFFAKS